MSRQFGLGWSYNDSILGTLGTQTLVESPAVGRVRMVEKVRFRFEHTGTAVWWFLHRGTPSGGLVVHGKTYAPGSYEFDGPFILKAGEDLGVLPLLITVSLGEFEADWSER